MHSRIFQISTSPISTDEYITTSDYDDHWFTISIADYMSTDNERADDIDCLRSYLSKSIAFDETNDSFIIQPTGKEAYFTPRYDSFVGARDKTLEMGLAEFSKSYSGCSENSEFPMLIWLMNEAFCSKFGYYVSSDEYGTVSIDKFIRQAKHGIRYYIGGVLDYHF